MIAELGRMEALVVPTGAGGVNGAVGAAAQELATGATVTASHAGHQLVRLLTCTWLCVTIRFRCCRAAVPTRGVQERCSTLEAAARSLEAAADVRLARVLPTTCKCRSKAHDSSNCSRPSGLRNCRLTCLCFVPWQKWTRPTSTRVRSSR